MWRLAISLLCATAWAQYFPPSGGGGGGYTGCTADGSNGITCTGGMATGSGGTVTGILTLTGKTSGSTVTLTAADATGTGNITVPGKTGLATYVTAARTAGNCAQYDSDGVGLVDAGSACGVAAPGMVRLAQTVLSGAASSVTFATISQAYSNLIIKWIGRSSTSANDDIVYMQFNTDSGTNYAYSQVATPGNGTTSLGHGTSVSTCDIALISAASAPTNSAGWGDITIPGYAQTTFVKGAYGSYLDWFSGPNVESGEISCVWNSATAISTVTLLLTSGANFVTGSTFTLYGAL